MSREDNRLPLSSCYLNGKWVQPSELVLGVDDLGVAMGVTVSERLRTFGGKLFRTSDHLLRLKRSLEIIQLDAEHIIKTVSTLLPEVVRRASKSLPHGSDLGITIFISPGTLAANNKKVPTICVYGLPLPFNTWASKYTSGEHLVISKVQQVPAECWPRELKCRSRMHYYLADIEAQNFDSEARALLLDSNGKLCEASTANVILAKDGCLVSPKLDEILPGVSLAALQELADSLGIAFEYRDILPEEIYTADELLLASTSSCLIPATRCNGEKIGNGTPGPIFQKLMHAWSERVGINILQQAHQFS